MLAQSVPLNTIFMLIVYKFIYGLFCGILVDFCLRSKPLKADISALCKDENCPCEKDPSIVKAAAFHSIKITLFIFAVTLCLNFGMEYISLSEPLKNALKMPLLSEILSALFALVPNCSSSIILTQLYIEESINLSTMLSGTLVGSGVGLLVLFRMNRHLKENLKILLILYLCGVSGGLISNLILP